MSTAAVDLSGLLHAQDSVCGEPEIRMTWSDDFGAIWSPPRVLSKGGDNYLP